MTPPVHQRGMFWHDGFHVAGNGHRCRCGARWNYDCEAWAENDRRDLCAALDTGRDDG